MAVDHMRGALRRNRFGADALPAAPLVAAAVGQALVASIADDLAIGLAIALLTTVPVAFRRVLPADDQEPVRTGFRLIVERAGMEVAGSRTTSSLWTCACP